MVKVVGVRFEPLGRIHYYYPKNNETYEYDQKVLVELDKSKSIGIVAIPSKEVEEEDLEKDTNTILKIAGPNHLQQVLKNEEDAKKAFDIAKEKIKKHHLEMKLVDVYYTFDRNKMIFSFTAEGRIDFRELVRDLASVFKTRIELKQIGVRDEAKKLGGLGPCGRPLCCSSFLGDFVPVSIKMAKDQNLSLNPTKISGLCGRLMCCLNYENEEYERLKKLLPDYGSLVETPDGPGRVVGLNILSQIIKVKLKNREVALEYHSDELLLSKETMKKED